MMTPKENFLELLKPNGQPDRQLCQYEALHMCLNDPINTYLRGNRKRGTVSKDRWGTTISFPADAPGPMPVTTDGLAVCPDITHWRETVHAPDIAACTEGWEACRAAARAACGEEKLLAGFMGTGIFEQCHFLMGFEDTLTNLYEHPQEMHALIDYITTYRLLYVKLLIDNLQPDVIFSHDDWGTKDALFMKPEKWREFFKEPYRRFYGYIRSRGVIAIHHADSYLVPIVEDMVEIGIQVWQGVLPENDIPALQQKLHGRLVLMGGMGAAIDRTDAAPEEIYGYAMDTLRRCCPGGHYIPSITYGLPGAVYPHVDEYIDRAIADYNRALHVLRFDLPSVPRRVRAVAVRQAAGAAVENGDVLARLAAALEKGQQKKVLTLCRERGLTLAAAESCTGGLIAKRLTDIPGASQVFLGGVVSYTNHVKQQVLRVPENLLARCGAVSAEVARAMALGVRVLTGADLAVSVTGLAGPDGDDRGNPVGTVFVGLSAPEGVTVRHLTLGGDRERIRTLSAHHAFDMLRRYLTNLPTEGE